MAKWGQIIIMISDFGPPAPFIGFGIIPSSQVNISSSQKANIHLKQAVFYRIALFSAAELSKTKA